VSDGSFPGRQGVPISEASNLNRTGSGRLMIGGHGDGWIATPFAKQSKAKIGKKPHMEVEPRRLTCV